ncbi:MAG: endonuclease/exonuclease/phosphatase family protein [Anaerolineaceae bacterium]|nr:endonuclease/exonuclease/phosphatase family protein [Anaerolineaceae bacterium]
MELNVVTVNVSADFTTPPGVPPWDERKSLLVEALLAAQPHLIGLQEVTTIQRHFLQSALSDFTALTVPVVDPDPALVTAWRAHYAAFGLPDIPNPYELLLFYRTAELELIASGHWWLSPTPERPSIGFGNVAPRAVQWARLMHLSTRFEFICFNTHIDHRCPEPMVALCRSRFADYLPLNLPLIFMGDFNFNPTTANYTLLRKDDWLDPHEAVEAAEVPTFLYDTPHQMPGGRIDHIFYRGRGLAPLAWERLVSPEPERRLSDHDPVLVRFAITLPQLEGQRP